MSFSNDESYIYKHISKCARESNHKPALIIGAGAVTFLPTSRAIKKAIINWLLDLTPDAEKKLNISEVIARINDNRLTLEMLFSLLSYRLGDKYFDPQETWKMFVNVNTDKLPLTSLQIASLRKNGKVGPILTTNFDQSLVYSFEKLGIKYNLKTTESIQNGGSSFESINEDDLVILHGTLVKKSETNLDMLKEEYKNDYESPTTIVARKLARPFPPKTAKYIKNLIQYRNTYFVGYSGYDQYDMNLLLSELFNDEESVNSKNGDVFGYWVSRRRENPQDSFSPFVKNIIFSDNITHSVISCDFSYSLKKEAELELVKKYAVDTDHNDRAPIQNIFETTPVESIINILKDIEYGLDRIWSVTEHYYLVSLGYSNDIVSKFSGLYESEGKELNYYFGFDITRLVNTHNEYWNKRFISPKSVEKSFISIVEDIDRIINDTSINLRNIDKSIFTLCKAMSKDYLGLLYMNRKDSNKCLEKSTAYFKEVIADCNYSDALAETNSLDKTEVKLLNQLVPTDMWRLIANDNLARIAIQNSDANALGLYISIISNRKKYIDEGKDDFEIAHYPQLALRCSEITKYLYGVKNNSDLPKLPASRSSQNQINDFISTAESAYEKFSSLSSLKNYRFITLYDIKIMNAMVKGDKNLVAVELESLIKNYQHSYKNDQNSIKFSKGVLERVSEFSKTVSSISDNLESQINLFNSILTKYDNPL
ncbi:SIR2 family protein [Alteromonadaceae bacterium BrNp21-10]|nr:SIR2 family protein [Alteromonadaceae bacterium BrNp21-10]